MVTYSDLAQFHFVMSLTERSGCKITLMEALFKELIAPESHQHPESLTDSSEIQSDCDLSVKKPSLTPTQVGVIIPIVSLVSKKKYVLHGALCVYTVCLHIYCMCFSLHPVWFDCTYRMGKMTSIAPLPPFTLHLPLYLSPFLTTNSPFCHSNYYYRVT